MLLTSNVPLLQMTAASVIDQLYEFVTQVSAYVLGAIDAFGYYGIFVGMTIESIGIPLPSEIILPYGGYLAYLGHLNFFAVVVVGTFACLVGSLCTYFIAFHGGNYLFERYGKYIGVTKRELNVANTWFDKYGEISVFASRMVPGVRAYSSIPAGIYRMDIKKFMIYTFAGSLPWNLGLTFAGFYLGAKWASISSAYYNVAAAVLVMLTIVVAFLVLRKRSRKRRGQNKASR
jgi:membrane protein DedA with SNARE-associated domain